MSEDTRGYTITTTSGTAGDACRIAIENFIGRKVDVMPHLKAAIAADPNCGMAQAATGLILYGGRNVNFRPMIRASLEAAQRVATGLTQREQLYVKALEASAAGQLTDAIACYETILAHHPTDLFAQVLCQFELFWIGEMAWSADISGRINGAWSNRVPGYSTYLSCRAFDLEETRRFAEAEALGRQSVEVDASNVWGTHAVAHVLIMQGRCDDGIDWLDGLKGNWDEANQLKLHLWWHRCLFHLEKGEHDAVLEIYDNWVRNRELPLLKAMPDLYIDLQNGASMLQRLELCGVDVGDRWQEMAELTLKRVEDTSSPFTSAHFAVILAASGQVAACERLLQRMREFAASDRGTLGPRYAVAAIPAAEAAVAHRRGDYQRVLDVLMPARRMLWQMGGSHAQRDLFFLLLVDAAKRLRRSDLLNILFRDIEAAGFIEPMSRIGYQGAAATLQ